jgi:hypothetical protein
MVFCNPQKRANRALLGGQQPTHFEIGKSQPTQGQGGCHRCKTAENPSKTPLQPVFPAAVIAGWVQSQPTRLSPAFLSTLGQLPQ